MSHRDSAEILFIAPQLPTPLDTGGKIRTFYQLKALASRYRVDLLALGPEAEAPDPLWEGLRASLRSVSCVPRDGLGRAGAARAAARSLLGSLPYPVEKYRSEAASAAIARMTSESRYLAAHFDSLHTFRFAEFVAPPTRLVLDEHNVEALILERMGQVEPSRIKRRLIADQAERTDRFERRCALAAHRVLLCSEDDRALLSARTGRSAGFEVIPNGVDLSRFAPAGAIEDAGGASGEAGREGRYAMFLGSLDWWPNSDGISWFIKEIWPKVRALDPSLGLKVVGRNPSAELEGMGGGGVEIVGGVPDVRPWMRGCSVFVVPLRVGGGTRLKILEAMAMGAPIVSTALGCEGIEASAGEDLLVEDSPEGFAEAVVKVGGDERLQRALADAGRRLVERRYSWEAIGARLGEVYASLAGEVDGLVG